MRLTLFDFDGTLTTRDSLMPFLRHAVGMPRFVRRSVQCAPDLLAYAAGRIANDVAKERVLTTFFGGRDVRDIEAAGAEFARCGVPGLLRPAMLAVVRRHRDAGDTCVVVSASLSVYLEPWAAAEGLFDTVLCSRLDVDAAGRATGRIVPRNCHGPEKTRRIDAWLAGRRATHVTAYGDSRGDFEMMAMADDARWLGRASRRPAAALAVEH